MRASSNCCRAFLTVWLVGLGFALGCDPTATLSETRFERVRIGVITSLTGGLESFGPGWRDAALLAAQEVNAAGGVLEGRLIEIVVADDQTNADVGRSAATRLIEEDGVVALIGAASSSVSLQVAEVAFAAEVPQVSCCSTSPDLTTAQPESDRYLFRTSSAIRPMPMERNHSTPFMANGPRI
jgi:ABC-type branched-subunit amino acid transport system substrate-binding protein